MVGLTGESTANLGEALAESERAGQESAPITGPASTTPLEGLFQAGFLVGAVALPPSLASWFSEDVKLSAGGEAVAGVSVAEAASEDSDDDDDNGD